MSEMKERNGEIVVFPHIVTDRAKPGIIAINDRGERFVNEANSYHRFVQAMMAEQQRGVERLYLIADRRALNRYGLGLVRARPGLHRKFIKAGYLIKAESIAALAGRLEINSSVLETTIQEFNQCATTGTDRKFHRGDSSYNRAMGDKNAKHPTLAPLLDAPFYAVRIVTGDLARRRGFSLMQRLAC